MSLSSPADRRVESPAGQAPTRSLLTQAELVWVWGVGVMFRLRLPWIGRLRLSVADLVLLPVLISWAVREPPAELRQLWRVTAVRWFVVFAVVIAIGGVAVALGTLGTLPPEVLLARPGIMLLMLSSCMILAATPGRVGAVEDLIVWFAKSAAVFNLFALAGAIARYGFGIANPMMFLGDSLRLAGFVLNPNTYGGFLAIAVTVQAAAVALGRPIFRTWWLEVGNGLALLVGLILTISRGAWIGTVAGLLVVAIIAGFRRHAWRVRTARLGLVAAALGVIVLLLAVTQWTTTRQVESVNPRPALQTRLDLYRPQGGPLLQELLRVARDPSGAADRWAITRVAFDLYRRSVWSVLFGIGGGSFIEESEHSALGFRTTIHNTYVWALVEHGIPGLLALCGFLLTLAVPLLAIFRRAPRIDFSSSVLLAALACTLVIFLTHNAVTERYVWLVWGLGLFRLRVDHPEADAPSETSRGLDAQ